MPVAGDRRKILNDKKQYQGPIPPEDLAFAFIILYAYKHKLTVSMKIGDKTLGAAAALAAYKASSTMVDQANTMGSVQSWLNNSLGSGGDIQTAVLNGIASTGIHYAKNLIAKAAAVAAEKTVNLGSRFMEPNMYTEFLENGYTPTNVLSLLTVVDNDCPGLFTFVRILLADGDEAKALLELFAKNMTKISLTELNEA
jgi:hypothetical protein